MAKITGGPHRGHAAGDTDIEKQASQLASDVKYKVKKKLSGATHMNPAQIARAYEEQLNRSKTAGTPPAVIALAKKKLMGAPKPAVRKEEFDNGAELATESVANALYKVFVEKKEVDVDEQIKELKEAYSKVNRKGERLYHVIVTDKKTGNTYTRDATREKIAELRANPNIASVEMSERQLDSEKEKTKGANTARVKAGKGLDPVGKEDSDPDNDGTPINRDKNDQYIMKRRAAIGKAIAGRGTQKEEFLGEVNTEKDNPDANEKEIDIMKGQNKVVIAPEVPGSGKKSSSFMQVSHYDMLGNPLSESEIKLNKIIQEKTLTAAETAKKEQIVKSLKPKYGKTSKTYAIATSVAKRVAEETVAQADKKAKKEQDEMDPRSIPTAVNLAKNKLRAMGLKCSYEPEGEQIDEMLPALAAGAALLAAPAVIKKVFDKPAQKALDAAANNPNRRLMTGGTVGQLKQAQNNSYELEGEVLGEEESDRANDERLMRGGVGAGRGDSSRPAPAPGTQRKKRRRSSAPSAIDLVRDSIKKKYGEGSLM
jgi:hypothetical protein